MKVAQRYAKNKNAKKMKKLLKNINKCRVLLDRCDSGNAVFNLDSCQHVTAKDMLLDVCSHEYYLHLETCYRDRLYRKNKITQVDKKVGEFHVDKSEEYLISLERLKESMKTKTEVGGILRQYRLQNIQNKFLAEEQAALQNFENEKRLLWEHIHSDLQEKIQRLEEDRINVDIDADLWLNYNGKRRMNLTERRKAVSVDGPYIVHMLDEVQILEDWALIKNNLSGRKVEIM